MELQKKKKKKHHCLSFHFAAIESVYSCHSLTVQSQLTVCKSIALLFLITQFTNENYFSLISTIEIYSEICLFFFLSPIDQKFISDIEKKIANFFAMKSVKWKTKSEQNHCQEDASKRFIFTILVKHEIYYVLHRIPLWSKNSFSNVNRMREVFAFICIVCGKMEKQHRNCVNIFILFTLIFLH